MQKRSGSLVGTSFAVAILLIGALFRESRLGKSRAEDDAPLAARQSLFSPSIVELIPNKAQSRRNSVHRSSPAATCPLPTPYRRFHADSETPSLDEVARTTSSKASCSVTFKETCGQTGISAARLARGSKPDSARKLRSLRAPLFGSFARISKFRVAESNDPIFEKKVSRLEI